MKYTPIIGGSDFDIALRRLRQVLKIEADDDPHTHNEHGFRALYHTGYSNGGIRPVRLGSTEHGVEFGIHFRAEGEGDLDPLDVAGLFVKGGDDKTYITHSGEFGARPRGAFRDHAFREHMPGNGWIGVDGVESKRFLVTEIDGGVSDADILENVASFVAKVAPFVVKTRKPTDTETGKRDAGPARPAQNQPLNRILYGPPGTGKTYQTARHCVEICDEICDRTPDDEKKIRDRYRELVKCKRIEFITFHQSYGYEEFVEGLRPAPSEDGLRLEATPGVLKRIADRARENRGSPYVLVIDEINRANISKVMGEMITLLEEDKREGAKHEVAVTLPHSKKQFTLPANLHILGTMNTADRSIALIDTALRRRFDFEEMAPKPELLKVVEGINRRAVLEAINARLEYLIDRDHLIGHAWLMDAKAEVDHIMRRKIIPLLEEYFYDDRRKVRAVLGNTDDFVERSELKRPPGLDDAETEERFRWTVRKEFPEGAYDRLVKGRSTTPATDADE